MTIRDAMAEGVAGALEEQELRRQQVYDALGEDGDYARNVLHKLQMLTACDILMWGPRKIGERWVIDVVLRKPAPYGLPDSIDGVPLVLSQVEGEEIVTYMQGVPVAKMPVATAENCGRRKETLLHGPEVHPSGTVPS